MPPCAWCVMQRLIYLVIGVVALVGGFGGGAPDARLRRAGRAAGPGGRRRRLVPVQRGRQDVSCDQTFADRFMSGAGLDAAVPWLFGIYATCMDAVVSVLGVEYALEPGAVRGRAVVPAGRLGRGRA